MKRVVQIPILNSFRSGFLRDLPTGSLLITMRHLFNSTAMIFTILMILIATTPFSRTSRIISFAFGCVVVYQYLSIRSALSSLSVSRVLPPNGRLYQGEEFEMKFDLQNFGVSLFSHDVMLEDTFGPSKQSAINLSLLLEVPARTKVNHSYKRTCNGEMGRQTIGPLVIRVRDFLGIFEFCLYDDDVVEIEVLPRIKEIPRLPVEGSNSSLHYGGYEIAARGLSVNFSGIRPYAHGDSLRHVAWKISGKRGELVVKEFEKVVNADVSVVINLDPLIHLGSEGNSTWELAKQFALSAAKQQLSLGNSVQVLTNRRVLSSSKGGQSAEVLAKVLAGLSPVNEDALSYARRHSLEVAKDLIPAQSTLLYISVFDEKSHERELAAFAYFQELGVQIQVFYIDPTSFLSVDPLSSIDAISVFRSPKKLEHGIHRLRANGIDGFHLRHGEDFSRSIARGSLTSAKRMSGGR